MKTKITFLIIILIVVIRGVVSSLSDLESVSWEPPYNPGLEGVYQKNSILDKASLILDGEITGPEDTELGPDGFIYTGLEDGRIIRFPMASIDKQTLEHETFATTGGRPLGMEFDSHGHLIVADALKGILSISAEGEVSVLLDRVNGQRLRYPDDLTVDNDGIIWFTDMSGNFGYEDGLNFLFEGSATGRLLSYDRHSGKAEVHLKNLYSSNGVTLGPDDEYVLVNEFAMSRIMRYWIKGERRGDADVFAEHLPGLVDNITFNNEGLFWVAMPQVRDTSYDLLGYLPFVRDFLSLVPAEWVSGTNSHSLIVALDLQGQVKYNLQTGGEKYHTITSANQIGNNLVIGSLAMDSIAVYRLNSEPLNAQVENE